MFRFKLDISATEYDVTPIWDDALVKDVEQVQDQVFFRERLSGSALAFVREDYDLIAAQDIETEIIVIIETDETGSWTEYWRGVFTFADCEFDGDENRIEVTPRPRDRYEKVMEALDREFDLLELGPARTQLEYQRQPLLQIYLAGQGVLTNVTRGYVWEQQVTQPVTSALELQNTYHFALVKNVAFIPGTGDLSPDVSGEYDFAAGKIRLSDGLYQVRTKPSIVPPDFQWEIVELPAETTRYEAPLNANLGDEEGIFTSLSDPTSQCRYFGIDAYVRMMTNAATIGGNPTFDIPADDIVPRNRNYTKIIDIDTDTLTPSDNHQVGKTAYGRFYDDALHFSGEYFGKLVLVDETFPVAPSTWKEHSIWFYYDAAILALQVANSETKTLKECYRLSDVLKVLLAAIDPTVTHTTASSDFLYGSTNPVRGSAKIPMITPKSNIILADSDQAATKAPIRLGWIFELLRYAHNAYWWIDDANDLKIEHILYHHNGGSYTTPNIGTDLTTILEPKTGKPWAYRTQKYKYEKAEAPEQIRFEWMDKDLSVTFDGYPIEIRSPNIEKGRFEDRVISVFTPDIDWIQSSGSETQKDGFVFFEAISQAGNILLPLVVMDINGGDTEAIVQNGYASLVWMHDNYHLDGLPAEEVTINLVDTQANTVKRRKVQEIAFPGIPEPGPMELVKTVLGDGRVRRMAVNLSSREINATVEHDTQ